MKEEKSVQILKEAILLEKKGVAFYSHVASSAEDKKVAEFFSFMADEERYHIELLSEQLKRLAKGESFLLPELNSDNEKRVDKFVLDDQTKSRIKDAGFESSAISAAMLMEEKAVQLYSERAKESNDPVEKKLYEFLSAWENEHWTMLNDIDKELQEEIWFDNHFWPF